MPSFEERLSSVEKQLADITQRLWVIENRKKSVVFELPDNAAAEQFIDLMWTKEAEGIDYNFGTGNRMSVRLPSVPKCEELLKQKGVPYKILDQEKSS